MHHCTKGDYLYHGEVCQNPQKRHSLSRLPAGSAEAPFPYKSVFSAPEKVECPSPDTLIKTAKVDRGFVDSGQLE